MRLSFEKYHHHHQHIYRHASSIYTQQQMTGRAEYAVELVAFGFLEQRQCSIFPTCLSFSCRSRPPLVVH